MLTHGRRESGKEHRFDFGFEQRPSIFIFICQGCLTVVKVSPRVWKHGGRKTTPTDQLFQRSLGPAAFIKPMSHKVIFIEVIVVVATTAACAVGIGVKTLLQLLQFHEVDWVTQDSSHSAKTFDELGAF